MKRFALQLSVLAVFTAGGFWMGGKAEAQRSNRVFELRTYYAHEGKLEDLSARFRNHTLKYFEKHGMTNVGYWMPMDAEQKGKIIYLLAYPSRDAAKKSWDAFRQDAGWKAVAAETQKNGQLVAKVDSVYMEPIDYSPMK
jgi:NIPSNAP